MKKLCLFVLIVSLVFAFTYAEEKIKITEKEAFFYAYIDVVGTYNQMSQKIDDFIQQFFKQGLQPAGGLLTVYLNSPEVVKESELKWRVGFPIGNDIVVKEPLKKETYHKKKVLEYLHKGSYENLPKVYEKIHKFLKEKGLEFNLPTYEFYLNDPSQVKPEELLTRIELPIKN